MSSPLAPAARLRLLRLAVLLAGLVLAARIVWIQVVLHDQLRERAEIQWNKEVPLNPDRGALYDRNGAPLALSVTTWRLGVATELLERARSSRPDRLQKVAAVLAPIVGVEPKRLEQRLAGGAGRHLVLGSEVVLTREEKQRLARYPEVTLEDLRSRIYPHDGVGASLIGIFRYGGGQVVAEGLEMSLSGYLAGEAGQARVIETALPGKDLGQVVLEEAVHGQNLVLTLDMDLQAICEDRLAGAVEEYGAVGGSVLILEPHTGDILAAASWPLLPSRADRSDGDGIRNNRNFTGSYEPGSVFKIFTVASLLSNAAVDTGTVLDCSDGNFGRFYIHNDDGHSYGNLTLMQAFTKSSNIYMARAVGNLSAEEFYRDLVNFGFGQGTGMPYPGQTHGSLKPPGSWSGRSKPTIAIGQEVSATPLQLGLAIGAVANGGTLMAPRVVREVLDAEGRCIQRFKPEPLRRVLSAPLADLLQTAMGRVVTEGTGIGARTDWISIGGKTGTAQKSRDGHGYTPGAFIASFAGILPLDDPRLVILTLLDEPTGVYHYAAQSAVPLFRDIVADIRLGTDWLTDVPGALTGWLPPATETEAVVVPDVLYLSVSSAVQRLGSTGLEPVGTGKDGIVIQQIPAAGTRCQPGSRVVLTVASRMPDESEEAARCPDFAGLSNRQARSLAARMGLPLAIDGAGYVVRQRPGPGAVIPTEGVSLHMGPSWR